MYVSVPKVTMASISESTGHPWSRMLQGYMSDRTVIVEGLPPNMTPKVLKTLFTAYATEGEVEATEGEVEYEPMVEAISIHYSEEVDQGAKGFMITYSTSEDASSAAQSLDRSTIRWREVVSTIRVKLVSEHFPEQISPVAKPVLELWERLYQDEDSKDVEICVEDGKLKAHAIILSQLSTVFQAMLKSGMLEDRTKRIEMKDFTVDQMKFVLRLAYTSQSREPILQQADGTVAARPEVAKVPLEQLLGCAAFAKKYVVPGFLELSLQAIMDSLNETQFDRIMKFAVEHDISPLKLSCLRFAENSDTVKEKFDSRALDPEVDFELLAIWGKQRQAQSGQKRKFMHLGK